MKNNIILIIISLAFFCKPSVTSAQKSSFYCSAGDCKNGKGIQSEKIQYPKDDFNRKHYRYILHIANFVKGKKQGKGLRIEFDGPYGCYKEIYKYIGETDPGKIPNCKYLKLVDQVTYEDDEVKTGPEISYEYITRQYGVGSWHDYRRKKKFTMGNKYFPKYEDPQKIIFYRQLSYREPTSKKEARHPYPIYQIDSLEVMFENGYYKERHRADGIYIESLQDTTLQIAYIEKGSDWAITNIDNNKEAFNREIFFIDRRILHKWKPCELFSFPADQNNYQEIQLNDSTFYKGGTKNNLPHGFGILTQISEKKYEKHNHYNYENWTSHTEGYMELIYTGYFINGKKSCIGIEEKKYRHISFLKDSTIKSISETPYYKKFGDFENGFLKKGWTILYVNRHKIFPTKLKWTDGDKMVYRGTYNLSEPNLFPYNATKYKIKYKYVNYILERYEVGDFDEYGTLVWGRRYYGSGSDYSIISGGEVSANLARLGSLNIEEVVLYNGQQKMILRKDAMYVYFTDGTRAEGSEYVKRLPPNNKSNFMCPCPTCNGLGYIITNNTYTETDTRYEQKTENVGYLGYNLEKTYKVTEKEVKTQQLKSICTTCNGTKTIICK